MANIPMFLSYTADYSASAGGYTQEEIDAARSEEYWKGVCDGSIDGYVENYVPHSDPPAEIVTWAGGTDAQIVAMVQSADRGDIDLSEYWSVGNERQVQLCAMTASGSNDYGTWTVNEPHDAQTVTMVLMGKNCYTLKTAVKNKDGSTRTTCSFCVGQKNSTAELGHMNNGNTNFGSWDGCARRSWCNYCYRASLPLTLLPAFKQFEVKTAASYNGSSITTSDDYFALFAEKEIFGTRTYSNSTEAAALSQIEYYVTSSNRIKYVGNSGGSSSGWWERSPYSSSANFFCGVLSDGNASRYSASYGYGLAPFGCI